MHACTGTFQIATTKTKFQCESLGAFDFSSFSNLVILLHFYLFFLFSWRELRMITIISIDHISLCSSSFTKWKVISRVITTTKHCANLIWRFYSPQYNKERNSLASKWNYFWQAKREKMWTFKHQKPCTPYHQGLSGSSPPTGLHFLVQAYLVTCLLPDAPNQQLFGYKTIEDIAIYIQMIDILNSTEIAFMFG